MKHKGNNYFGNFINHLKSEHGRGILKELATHMGISYENLRQKRNGSLQPIASELTILVQKYNASPFYLLTGKGPLRNSDNIDLQNEINQLKQQLRDKERIILLYETRTPPPAELKTKPTTKQALTVKQL